MSKYCGIDAARYVRGRPKETSMTEKSKEGEREVNQFRAITAACITADSYSDFEEGYNEALKGAMEEYDRLPPVLSSYGINKTVGSPEKAREIKNIILKDLTSHIDSCRIFFSYFKAPKIYCYLDRERHNRVKYEKNKFMKRHLDNSYPHIAAWRLSQEKEYKLMLDSFQGHITSAWRDLEKSNSDLNIYSRGDSVNPLISTADLVSDYLIEDLLDGGRKILFETIRESLQGIGITPEVDWISDRFLPDVVPRRKLSIPVSKYLSKPTFYLLKPSNKYLDGKMLLNSPNGVKLLSKASKKEGCVKFLDKSQDRNFMEPEDYVIFFDEEGKDAAEVMLNSGYEFNCYHIKDVGDV